MRHDFSTNHLLMLCQAEVPLVMERRRGPRVDRNVFRTGDLGLYPRGEYDLTLTSTLRWTTPTWRGWRSKTWDRPRC